MSNIKAGQQAFLKVTQEPVFVLELREANSTQRYPGLSGKIAVVRRPTAGEMGVRHDIEFFTIEELETVEESRSRTISEMAEMKAQFNAQTSEAVSAAGQLGLLD